MKKNIYFFGFLIFICIGYCFSQINPKNHKYSLFISLLDSSGNIINPVADTNYIIFINASKPIKCTRQKNHITHMFVQNQIKYERKAANDSCWSDNPNPMYIVYNCYYGVPTLITSVYKSDTMNISIDGLFILSKKIINIYGLVYNQTLVDFYLDSVKFQKGNYIVDYSDNLVTKDPTRKVNSNVNPKYKLNINQWAKKD